MSDKNRKLAPATIAAQAAGAVNRADGGVVPGISMASTYERDRDNGAAVARKHLCARP